MSLLQLQNVNLRFNEITVLEEINYQIEKGDFVILLGSNGSGKSSLLKLLSRQYQADSGQIILQNQPIANFSAKEFNQHVTILTQNCSDSLFISLSVYENYLMVKKTKTLLTPHEEERAFLHNYLLDYNPNLSNKLDTPVHQLSGGEKQALALALALCLQHPPTLLLLDEHTSALDPKTSEQIMELTNHKIKEHHITCLLTTHDLDIALKYGNRVLALRMGKIFKTLDHEKVALSRQDLTEGYY